MTFEQDLRQRVRGEVATDPVTRGIYATDASMYELLPTAVVCPVDEADLRAAVACAAAHGVPIIPRGGGTGLAGQAIGRGLVVDCSKHLNRLLEVNVAERWARVQPGLVRDELNELLRPHGLYYAVDPATGNRCNVGGMIANNASGTRSLVYGKSIDNLLELRVLLSDGTVLELGELSPAAWRERAAADTREGHLLSRIREIVETNRDEINARYPQILRRASGYMLDEFTSTDHWNPAKLVCGSEGTLATILEAKVALHPVPTATAMVVVHFADLLDAVRHVEPILDYRPSAVEILDRALLHLARENHLTAHRCGFLDGDPAAVLAVEFQGHDPQAVAASAAGLAAELQRHGCGYAWPVLTTSAQQAAVWAVRKNGLGLMVRLRGDRKVTAFIEDAAVPVAVLGDYIAQVLAVCEQEGVPVVLYAHASVGLIHVRPVLNLKDQADIDRLKRIADHCFELVKGYGGSFSGEHGDGMVRSPFLERYFGPQLTQAFRDVKAAFDPAGLMTPGKIVDPEPIDANLRLGPSYQVEVPPTHYHFRADGGFAAAVEMCNGVGACRKALGGTMCPSYLALRDEAHSTRGRANALRLAMSGKLGPQALTSDGVQQVLDLCLACKGCLAECPSNVDLARLKGEVLQQRHDRVGLSLRDRLVGGSPWMAARLAGRLAPLANAVSGSRLGKWALRRFAGMDPQRTLPAYTREPFAVWFGGRQRLRSERRVVLFDDTWLSFHEPRVGIAAVELLESCGYEVLRAGAGCCQRPRLSHGLLRAARRDGERTLRNLDAYLDAGLPVVVCEPSCAAALTDDLPDLIDDLALGDRIRAGVQMIDVFLDREQRAGRLQVTWSSPVQQVLLHGHCHQKALYGTAGMTGIWSQIAALRVQELDAGCCGMAGSFGYEVEHRELSAKVAADRLLPALEAAPADCTVVACGFSCRHQIADLAGRQAVHWVETVRAAGQP
ncbi:MAG: FAD-binding protein [Fimbriimonadaceae bacterium]|nr:FAD-binding protein [Fimbriimonadaceae bacterium]